MRVEIDYEKLNLLLDNGLTIKEISEEFNANISTIRRKMKKFGLKSKFSFFKNEEVKCINCYTVFKSTVSQNRKFCTQSCSAIFNNKKRKKEEDEKEENKDKKIRIRKDRKIGTCLNCNIEIVRNNGKTKAKYCSNKCQSTFQMNLRIGNKTASSAIMKRYLILEHGEKCMDCGWCGVNPVSGRVPIELEHIDGNSENNSLENLKLLCPNCHSLTPTYKALNIGNGRYKRRKRYEENKSY